jgi:branched-chain amino acid transport system ATP-binding protein
MHDVNALELNGLSKSFGGLQVLRNLNFAIKPGERIAIIGPNGAGKTTLLSTITGVHRPNSGQVKLYGRDVTTLPPHRRLELGLGCGFQLNRLFYSLSVLENVHLALLGARPWLDKTFRPITVQHEVRDDARRLLDMMNLWSRRDEPVGAISYGEQRSLEIVFGLASEPKLLVLDEPTAGLSLAGITPFMQTIKDLAAETAILFTSHDMDVVFGLAERVIVLYFGEIVAEGTPQDIQENERVREIYLGEGVA